ncbi:sulfur carrier protein ThiS adenylyltransferase ThiF [Tichowtungia aerotolerans]|uniref:Sulfur carrier protein ThiS adenylyltransferase ThiF n=1 Tax=Tichowtungia aerotolerans TaxID=2697043 RepID=A0A6P1MGH7_9BACT|nr:sulfur carrier protein ThiS adenylyltransferase ThiF [Tichowtungia aerotolerans]QHI70696.1 sulfur carrier protein ThiS adenylyltransferase ThiF [Tichowtungia aerotolerans]
MPEIHVNETPFAVDQNTTLFRLRDAVKPDADILILNGAVASGDIPLSEGDCVSLIRRGEVPSEDELEALMAARHTPGVHQKVKTATVGIAGLGGLGSAIATALARVGIGKLIVADFDVVEPSNLNRQHYFVDQIGVPKTEATVSNLRKINPYVDVEAHCVKLMPETVFPLFGDVDVMIEAFDGAEQKAMLLQAFTAARPDVPFIGASGMAGYASGEMIGIKKLGPKLYIVGDLETGARPGCGLMAPRVGIAAHMQANLALRLIVDGIR